MISKNNKSKIRREKQKNTDNKKLLKSQMRKDQKLSVLQKRKGKQPNVKLMRRERPLSVLQKRKGKQPNVKLRKRDKLLSVLQKRKDKQPHREVHKSKKHREKDLNRLSLNLRNSVEFKEKLLKQSRFANKRKNQRKYSYKRKKLKN